MKVQNQLCISPVSRLKIVFPKLALCLLAVGGITASSAATIIFDDFSSDTVGTPTFAVDPSVAWVVDSGQFAANGTSVGNFIPTAGQLNIGTTAGTQIHIDLMPVLPNTPVTVSFRLRQSDGANQYWYGLNFGFNNAASGQSYIEQASPSTAAFVPLGSGTSGFASYDTNGGLTAGVAGAHLLTDGGVSSWQDISMIFDPVAGISVYQDDVLVSSWSNYLAMNTVDQFVITNYYGGVSWFVDDFTVVATVPEPSVTVMLGVSIAAVGTVFVMRRRKALVA